MAELMPRVGDTVRVTLEGVVNYTDGDYFEIDHGKWGFPAYRDGSVKSVEKVAPPVKVGDHVQTVEGLRALPKDAVVRTADSVVNVARGYDRWDVAGFGGADSSRDLALPVLVLFLPEPK